MNPKIHQLLILRHAKSDWNTDAPTDFDRPLNKRGKKDAPRVGRWLKKQGLMPDRVISSPARRAKMTVKRVCREIGFDEQAIVWDERIYGARLITLLDVLRDTPETVKTLLLVGHNPGLEDLLQCLGGDGTGVPADGKLLPTAALAQLELPEGWQRLEPGKAHLLTIVRPKSLPAESSD